MYVFQFSKHKNGDSTSLVKHSCELNYLWNPESTGDDALNLQMQTWWTNFAVYHNPNGASGNTWPKITATNPQVMNISDNL